MNVQHVILKLIEIFDEKSVLVDADSKQKYGTDFTQRYSPNPLAIVFPRCEEEVVQLVKLANEHALKLVPSGGRTGYSGGALAAFQEIVVSFERMNKILAFNAKDRTVRCQTGIITKELQEFAQQHHLFYPVDFASSGSSQIGGNIATNAGGIKVIRYGLTRNWVVGLKVVTGNGELLELNHGLIKNATGYDLLQLFIGSEGTLGFITEATIKLTECPLPQKVILFSFSKKEDLMDLLNEFKALRYLSAFEFFTDKAVKYVLEEQSLKFPFSRTSPFYALLEFDATKENEDLAIKILQECLSKNWIDDAVMSENLEQVQNIWRLRENISLSLRKYFPYKYDLSVVPSKIMEFMDEMDTFLSKIKIDTQVWFGHVGDGNLHLNILKPENMLVDEFFAYCDGLNSKIGELIEKYQGSMSAEHGIGLLKKDLLRYAKSEAEIAYMREIKKIFDRNNIMNPSKLI